jgi:KUP system potassium uptake protein
MDQTHGHSNKVTVASLLIALGIIYGDIGTSPLYVMKAIIGQKPITELLVYGGLSCVFWTIVFQTTFKYIILTLQADNKGEGGILSLYALVRRYGKYLIFPTIIGASTLLADGIITPPISVASAVEGLHYIPSLSHIPLVPIVIVILSILFFFQRYGTNAVGVFFGPIMLVWFTMLAVLGFSQIVLHPNIINAFNPYYAYKFLSEYPSAFIVLGAVFLATTGAEALYSDLGHCGRENIRITWVLVKVCLLVNYLGQGAWLMSLGEGALLAGKNPLFEIMPDWFLIPGILIATCAAIIASQALISGSFTLINEAINMNFWPRVAVRQPSEIKGQIYIPSINLLLWGGCVLMILYFQNSTNMEAAYGLAITLTMLVTTFLLAFFLKFKLKWNTFIVGFIALLFFTIEISFLLANIHKFPDGGYITILIAALFIHTMYSVYKGRQISNKFTRFVDLKKHIPMLQELSEDEEIEKFSTHLIFLTKANHQFDIEEKIINSIFAKKPKKADVYWFLHIDRTNEPYTLNYDITELVDDKVIKVNLNVGFRIQPKSEVYFKKIVQDLIANKELNLHNRPDGSTKYNSEPDFKFVVLEKALSVENEFAFSDGILLSSYFALKRLGQSDETAFGLEKCDTVVEEYPLVYQAAPDTVKLRRVKAHDHHN